MIYWLIYIILDSIVNWYWIEKIKKIPNYLILTIVRAWFFILIGITVPITPQTFVEWFLFTSCSFWVIFDISLNKLRDKGWRYIGENSFIDRVGKKHPVFYWVAKTIAFILLMWFIIVGI